MQYQNKVYICSTKSKVMITISILKNGKLVKQFRCLLKMKDKYFALAFDIAGGMWNGKDKFKVVVNE